MSFKHLENDIAVFLILKPLQWFTGGTWNSHIDLIKLKSTISKMILGFFKVGRLI